jgi:hypothetical protein
MSLIRFCDFQGAGRCGNGVWGKLFGLGVGSKYGVRIMGYGEGLVILVSLKGDRGQFWALSERELRERTSRLEMLSALPQMHQQQLTDTTGNVLRSIDGTKPLTLLL